MPTTSNFGWTTPADTDLVKDGAAAIRTLGNGIDTSFLDLKGGTTGQVLSKNSNTDLDYTWITPNVGDITEVQAGTGISVASGTGPIPVITNTATTTIDAEGDLLVGDAADALQRLAIGSNGNVLTVDTAVDGKIKWAAPSAAMTLLDTLSLSGSSTASATISSAYPQFIIYIKGLYGSTNQGMYIRLNGDSGSNYSYAFVNDGTLAEATNSATYARIGNYSTSSAAKETSNQIINIMRPSDTDQVFISTSAQYYNVNLQTFDCTAVYDNSAAITSVTIGTIGGTMTAGTAYIYGVK